MVKINGLTYAEAEAVLNQPASAKVKEYLNTPYKISTDKIKFYAANGYVKLEKILEGDVLAEVRRITDAAVLVRKEQDKRTLAQKSQYEQSFLQCGYLCWDFPAVRDVVFSKRLAGIARELMQVDGVRLWHDQALYKEAGGRHTDMHQDTSYWPVSSDKSTTVWLALVDVPVEKGCLYFLPGSQDTVYKEYVDIFKNPHVPDSLKTREKINVPLQAGDATYHSGYTFHGANENRTTELRRAMTVIYIDKEMKFDASDERNATHTSCRGLKDGEIIDTKFTPRLA